MAVQQSRSTHTCLCLYIVLFSSVSTPKHVYNFSIKLEIFELVSMSRVSRIRWVSGSRIKMLQTPALPRIVAIEARNIRVYPFMTRYRL